MNLNLTTPAKAGLGASAAAGTSLAAAGAGGAFSSGASVETKTEIENSELNKETTKDVVEETPKVENKEQVDIPKTEPIVDSEQPEFLDEFENLIDISESDTPDPNYFRFVSQDKKQNYELNTVGKTYGRFLIAVVGEKSDSNENWWGNIYDTYKESFTGESKTRVTDSPFYSEKEVDYGYNKNLNDGDSLNYLCHQTYKLAKSRSELQEKQDDEDSISIWEDLWNYCSEAKRIPVFLADEQGFNIAQDKLGFANKSNLLSTKDNNNTFLWKRLNNLFLNQKPEKIKDEYFKNFRTSLSNKAPSESNIPLKEKCREAFQILSSEEVGINKPSNEALLLYCSLNDSN